MPKTKESIAAYNKEYFARPYVIARAKIRNATRRKKRAEYKKTEAGKIADKRYRLTDKHKKQQSENRIKNRYGLTTDDVERIKSSQGYVCPICKQSPKHWHIDHDHNTGKVRGILCGPCNLALGLFHDNINTIEQAKDYLNGNL